MTFLEAINDVLVRLRENTVTSPTDSTYARLIASFVNDSKTQVENAYGWNALYQDIQVTTVAGTSTYALTGSGQRFRVLDAIDDTNNSELSLQPWSYISRQQRTAGVSDTAPRYYCFKDTDSNGDTQITLFPTPDAAYTLTFTCIVPQGELSASSDIIQVPSKPVVLGAYARAVAERGEDQGMLSSEIYGLFKDSLSDHIALESSRTADDNAWGVN